VTKWATIIDIIVITIKVILPSYNSPKVPKLVKPVNIIKVKTRKCSN